ncbi:hypothetical protein INF30_12355 [Lachnospiraceae bacterium DSM 108991]|uniref:Uncharacterized protein n=1 Tax=Claveliimonas monacensis TaxID=2779351 RepID=A0ABR9RM49_9FIRM|nr:hypothetical protein [Claveliimonas monacensis]MBE5064045.1 hypothetical protein [Claveliimonas monacensis]
MSKEEKRNQEVQQPEEEKDVTSQYCNSDHCQYDCTTSTSNKCNAVVTGLL